MSYSANPSRTIYHGFLTSSGEFDTGKFVESILLFNSTLLSSVAVLPKLIQVAGTEGVLQLLESGFLGVVAGGFNAQAIYDFKSPGFFSNRPLDRPLRYGFETIFVDHSSPGNPSPQELLERELDEAKGLASIQQADLLRIRDAILPSMRVMNGRELNTGEDFRADLKSRHDLISELLVELLAQAIQRPILKPDWRVRITEVSADVYQIDSNLPELLGINKPQLHEFLKGPFFEITGVNLQLRRMRAVNAASGLTGVQTRVIETRVDFLARIHVQSDKRQSFAKILEVADIPTIPAGSPFDVAELMKLRDTGVARSFRDWIQHAKALDERDIQDLIGGWRRKLGEILRAKNAKAIRFLMSTGVGTVLGPAGIAASVLDYFLDRFLPGMGPIGFVIGDYQRYAKKQGSK